MSKPTPQFLVKYNNYVLPGYAQGESFESSVSITDYNAPYSDDPISENIGTLPKNITITMLVWDDNYYACREQIEAAATYLRSKRSGYAKLNIGYNDRYYQAIPVSIKYDKAATDSYKTSKYEITFKAKPYSYSNSVHHLVATGDSTVSTDGGTYASNFPDEGSVTISGSSPRNSNDGTWSPVFVKINGGNNVTISGYTDTGDSCGYIATVGSGVVLIDTGNFESFDWANNNANAYISTPDYSLFVGVGKTNFSVTGASSVEFFWRDRWAL